MTFELSLNYENPPVFDRNLSEFGEVLDYFIKMFNYLTTKKHKNK